MCGILGTIHNDISEELFHASLKRLSHRGPDHTGWKCIKQDPLVWLGHCRLSIVDLSEAGNQPMHNEDQSLWLVCNGEIYNYPTLKAELIKKGHQFLSSSDSEIILHAYEEWGDDFIHRIEGMFAFVLYDIKTNTLIAARDHVGIKPLYYCETNQGFILASEASAIISLIKRKPDINPLSLAYILSLGYIPSPYCIWDNIYKLEAGSLLVYRNQCFQIKRYWLPPTECQNEVHEDHWNDLFSSVIQDHLLSDVPIGLFLSGGLDSTSIAVGLHQQNQKMEALTVGFPQSNQNDESVIASLTAKHLNFQHTIIPIKTQDISSLLGETLKAFDEPQAHGALLTMYCICNATAKNFKVVFAGDGGDECLAGYKWYQGLDYPVNPWLHFMKRISWSMRRKLNHSSDLFSKKVDKFKARSVLHYHAWRVHGRFLPDEVANMFAPTGLQYNDEIMIDPFQKYFTRSLPLRRALQRVDLMTFCCDSILPKVDRASMANSMEVRVPFLDRRIIEYGLTLPEFNDENVISKPILRNYLRNNIPKEILEQPKQGFSLRATENLDWENIAYEIDTGYLMQNGLLNPDWLHINPPSHRQYIERLWSLYMITKWLDIHLNN